MMIFIGANDSSQDGLQKIVRKKQRVEIGQILLGTTGRCLRETFFEGTWQRSILLKIYVMEGIEVTADQSLIRSNVAGNIFIFGLSGYFGAPGHNQNKTSCSLSISRRSMA